MKPNSHLVLIYCTLVIAALFGCSFLGLQGTQQANGGEQPATETATPIPATDTPVPTEPPTETAVPSATPTITPTPGPNFGAASVYAVSHLPGDRLLVTIQIPGGVEGVYQAVVGPSTLNCEILADYPDRLYCTGPEPYVNYAAREASLTLYSTSTGASVFQTQFNIPARPTPTPTPTDMPTLTPGP